MSTIVQRFSNDKRQNDILVNRFIVKENSFKLFQVSYPCKQTRSTSTTPSSVNRHHVISFQHILLNEQSKVVFHNKKEVSRHDL